MGPIYLILQLKIKFSGMEYWAINLARGVKLELGYIKQVFETTSRDQINIIAFVNF